MDHSFLSALILLLLVLDPFGSLPIFILLMRAVPAERRTRWRCARWALPLGCCWPSCSWAKAFAGDAPVRAFARSGRRRDPDDHRDAHDLLVAGRRGHGWRRAASPSSSRWPCRCWRGPRRWLPCCCWSRQPDRIGRCGIGALSVAMLVSGTVLLLADRIRKLLGDLVVTA